MFRVCGETIHSAYMKRFHGLVTTGKNCYYRLLERESMDWRKAIDSNEYTFPCHTSQRENYCFRRAEMSNLRRHDFRENRHSHGGHQ